MADIHTLNEQIMAYLVANRSPPRHLLEARKQACAAEAADRGGAPPPPGLLRQCDSLG